MDDYSSLFLKWVSFLLSDFIEGGYVNDPKDNGGETKYGISKKSYPQLDIASLSRDQATGIYHRDYWRGVSGDLLPPGVGFIVADCAVHHGQLQAIKWLQEVLKVDVDGIIGPQTIGAARSADRDDLIARLTTRRIVGMSGHADWKTYRNGWITRWVRMAMESRA